MVRTDLSVLHLNKGMTETVWDVEASETLTNDQIAWIMLESCKDMNTQFLKND